MMSSKGRLKRLREISNKSDTPYKARKPSRCCTWKGPERPAFAKTTRSALVRMLVAAPLRIPVGTILCRARLLDGAIITEVGPLGTTRISSVQSLSQSCPTLCDSMDFRPPCPSSSPRVYSNSCPLSW